MLAPDYDARQPEAEGVGLGRVRARVRVRVRVGASPGGGKALLLRVRVRVRARSRGRARGGGRALLLCGGYALWIPDEECAEVERRVDHPPHAVPTWTKVVESAASEAARSSIRGHGCTVSGCPNPNLWLGLAPHGPHKVQP